ncbi:hypothetical protein ACTFIR_002880 [Dictyostelium discoideum]
MYVYNKLRQSKSKDVTCFLSTRKILLTEYSKGDCMRVYETKVKKPNFAIRKVAQLQIEMPQEQREIVKKLPLVGNIRVEKLTVNFIGFCILSISSILLLVLRNGRKVKYVELLITVIGGIGYNINRQIIQEIKQYKDIIYENNWFIIRKIYTIGEKKAYMIQKIKEYCRTHQLPYKKEYETVISKKLEKVGIEEIPLLVKQELTNTLVTESSGFPYESIAAVGLILALGGLGAYVGYSIFKDLKGCSFGLYALRPMTRLPMLPLPDGSVGFGYLGNYKIMTQVTEGAVKIIENIN